MNPKNNKEEITLEQVPLIIKLIKRILLDALEKRASDIFIEPLEDCLRVRFRVDGLLCEIEKYPPEQSSYFITAIKAMSGLDVAEHRFPQDGGFSSELEKRKVDFRVSILPTNLGEKAVIRVLDKGRIQLDLDTLGFDEEALGMLKRNLSKPYGIILVCGPTGSGKTTTLYSCIKFLNSPKINIVTVEDPVEFQLAGVNQVCVQESLGLTFASALRAILRQDPNVILVGEIRDAETADIAIKASLTGHLVLSTLHTPTATAAILRLVNMGIEPFLVASSCLVSIAQALLRLLCPYCKEGIPANETLKRELERNGLKLPEGFVYHKAKGCKFCNFTGYLDRKPIVELLEMDEEIKAMLVKGETEIKIREKARQKGMRTLREKALENILNGLTTLEEAYRISPDR